MLFSSAFVASSDSQSVFFVLWMVVGFAILAAGAVAVYRANRSFRRRQRELAVVSSVSGVQRPDHGLASAA